MSKSIFVGIVIGALAISLAASAILTSEVQASYRDSFLDRANNNLDRHIEAGGAHGEAAQEIKDKLNDGGDGGRET